jgi:hypothetical protein
MESGEDRPRIVKRETPKGQTGYIIYLGDEMLGWSLEYKTSFDEILVPHRDGPNRKKKRR